MPVASDDKPAIQLWVADLDAPGLRAACDAGWLSEGEHTRLHRSAGAADTPVRFAVGRCVVRRLLGDWLGQPPASVSLARHRHGRLRLGADGSAAWCRQGRWLVLAMGGCRGIGCSLVSVAGNRRRRWMARLGGRPDDAGRLAQVVPRPVVAAHGRHADTNGQRALLVTDTAGAQWFCRESSLGPARPTALLAVGARDQGRPPPVRLAHVTEAAVAGPVDWNDRATVPAMAGPGRL